MREEILAKLTYAVGKHRSVAENHDWLWATILALRDHVIDDWMESTKRAEDSKAKRVYYLSLEFLVGRMLRDALNNLDLQNLFQQALNELDVKLDLIEMLEPDPALGNGGLGRLAACFMESMASLDIPAHGYGIRYNHGLFRQKIESGWQTEFPEQWLQDGNPWEFPRRETAYKVGFGGQVAITSGVDVMSPCRWSPSEVVVASACDLPMVGWRGKRVNPLRLWTARSVDPILLNAFNSGDYVAALSESNRAAIISRVLYPSDSTPAGQELRLRQEYFFTSASLQDIIHRHIKSHGDIRSLKEKAAIQLNDTHPAIAVAELMRLLLDHHGLPWNEAWDITIAVLSYTNHTLLPEALESWPVHLMKESVFRDLDQLYPGRINNKTNGITPRRWLFNINPDLTNLLREITGDRLYDDLESMKAASESVHDSHFRDRYQAIKLAHKVKLSNHVRQELDIAIDPHAMFDVQAKRIHEYKRQLLNILETISLYNAMRTHPGRAWAPRVKIFSGKAASSYAQAKLIIKLINDVANVINNDPLIGERLKVVFLPNYNVSLAELLVPAADLSEQISTAGMEASGTGNMKFALNGALTIGTLDGANIEIMERVGSQNIAIFGMTAEQVNDRRRNGYQPQMSIEGSADLTAVLAAL
ncbi:MAG: glycogen phosphorylase, partial [Alphaproteobacteria bacterium]|nr:glycogen phosphorylase [Alphaproteobacteria bacterium]